MFPPVFPTGDWTFAWRFIKRSTKDQSFPLTGAEKVYVFPAGKLQ